VIAEIIGTYFLVFAGCGSVVVNKIYGSVTFPGVCITWGLIVMVMCYSVGHISGGHFNPAVTITWTLFRRISIKEAPLYIFAQLLGATLASGTLSMMFDISSKTYFGTVNDLAGVAVGMTIMLNMFIAGPVSGGSMNPARSIGPALVVHVYKGLWIYVVGPIVGAIAGAIAYNLLRSVGKPNSEFAGAEPLRNIVVG
ncbi:hypothetical protein TSUD_212120, partial [Trifolium subterraneum]